MRLLALMTAVAVGLGGLRKQTPDFPGAFVRSRLVAKDVAERECLSLGDNLYDQDVAEIGTCRPLGLHDVGSAANVHWMYGTYERRWLVPPADTVAEIEVIVFTTQSSRRGSPSSAPSLQPVWHYRYERAMLRSVTPEVVAAAGGATLLSVDECVNGTGGCSQSFAIYRRGSPHAVKRAFLDSLNRRFPDGVRHGFHVDIRTLSGSLGLYSGNDANCCPSRIADFSLRLRNNSLELATLKLRHAN